MRKSSEEVTEEIGPLSEVEGDRSRLFRHAMRGRWKKVVKAYEENSENRKAKLTSSGDTALHIAVSDGKTATVQKLVQTMGKEASEILKITNDGGDTALHLAAALGNVDICRLMALQDKKLVAVRNEEGESPLFLAAFHGKKEAFLCLHTFNELDKDDFSSLRKSNGDTILHAAIGGEYFSLAHQIIVLFPLLVNWVNENGLTPLHILASKPNAFKSSSRLGFFDRIIYHCLYVEPIGSEPRPKFKSGPRYPENYETCIQCLSLIKTSIGVVSTIKCKTDDEEDPQQKGPAVIGASSSAKESESKDDQITADIDTVKKGSEKGINQSNEEDEEGQLLYPPNYVKCLMFFRLSLNALLVILGLGIGQISDLKERKGKYKWANKIMKELVDHTSPQYEYTGRDPGESKPAAFLLPPNPPTPDNIDATDQTGDKNASAADSSTAIQNRNAKGSDPRPSEEKDAKIELTEIVDKFLKSYSVAIQELKTPDKKLVQLNFEEKKGLKSGRKETPILTAARMGVTEMVKKILDKFPVAIQDLDSNKKNIALLAVENRQTRVYKLLLKQKYSRESVLRQVDNEGNNALHLAATFGEYRPWLLSGAAFEMQWEIKWYEFVKKSMPRDFYDRLNKEGKTPREIFTETHKDLVKEGREWMTTTSESCSVVTALIATVSFATSSTVPGGVDEKSGKPILENEPVFNAFAISSLVALCSSVTALVFFLSILTSRYQARDFTMSLPRKLLLGLTSMFTSIVAILVSFCAGHSFVITDQMKSAALPIYAATCLPVTFFALAQLHLYIDLVWAIVRKVPHRSHRGFPI